MGGAVSTAAAADFLTPDKMPARIKPDFFVMTYGAPRFGTKAFRQSYDAKMEGKHWFFANQRDPVPHLPTHNLGYEHVGKLKYFASGGKFVPGMTKDEAGLQVQAQGEVAKAMEHWRSLEESFKRYEDDEAAFEKLVGIIAESIPDPNAPIAQDAEPGLQGDSLWTADAHKTKVYLENIAALAAQA